MDLMAFDLLGGGLGNRQQGGVSWKIKGIQTENLSRCQPQGLQFHIVLDQRIGNDDVAWPDAGLNCTGNADIDDAAHGKFRDQHLGASCGIDLAHAAAPGHDGLAQIAAAMKVHAGALDGLGLLQALQHNLQLLAHGDNNSKCRHKTGAFKRPDQTARIRTMATVYGSDAPDRVRCPLSVPPNGQWLRTSTFWQPGRRQARCCTGAAGRPVQPTRCSQCRAYWQYQYAWRAFRSSCRHRAASLCSPNRAGGLLSGRPS